jgi:outer membrane lipoprotein-sorting protein
MRVMSKVAAIGLSSGLVMVGTSAARADDCATLMSALYAQAKVPYAGTITTVEPGKPGVNGEMVVIGEKMYVQANGTWMSMPYSAQETIALMTEKAKASENTCRKTGADTIDGEAATVYSQHFEKKGLSADSRIWVSDKRGLPLKVEAHFSSGMSLTQTTRYDNIRPPAGVK